MPVIRCKPFSKAVRLTPRPTFVEDLVAATIKSEVLTSAELQERSSGIEQLQLELCCEHKIVFADFQRQLQAVVLASGRLFRLWANHQPVLLVVIVKVRCCGCDLRNIRRHRVAKPH